MTQKELDEYLLRIESEDDEDIIEKNKSPQDRYIDKKSNQYKDQLTRYDWFLDKIVPFMVNDGRDWYINFSNDLFCKNELKAYNEWKKVDRDFIKCRLIDRFEQYLYCTDPDKYEEYEHRKMSRLI